MVQMHARRAACNKQFKNLYLTLTPEIKTLIPLRICVFAFVQRNMKCEIGRPKIVYFGVLSYSPEVKLGGIKTRRRVAEGKNHQSFGFSPRFRPNMLPVVEKHGPKNLRNQKVGKWEKWISAIAKDDTKKR